MLFVLTFVNTFETSIYEQQKINENEQDKMMLVLGEKYIKKLVTHW